MQAILIQILGKPSSKNNRWIQMLSRISNQLLGHPSYLFLLLPHNTHSIYFDLQEIRLIRLKKLKFLSLMTKYLPATCIQVLPKPYIIRITIANMKNVMLLWFKSIFLLTHFQYDWGHQRLHIQNLSKYSQALLHFSSQSYANGFLLLVKKWLLIFRKLYIIY